jgi:hypothetical protein
VVGIVSEGLPRLLPDLESLLETGETLPASTESPVPAMMNERYGAR